MAHGSPPTSYAWTGLEAAPQAQPVTPRSPNGADIRVGPNGRVEGVDGMLDQIAAALSRHAGPMLVRDVLPAVQEDTAMQERMGAAAGQAMASRLIPWVALGAGALGVLAVVQVVRWRRERQQASGQNGRPRSRRRGRS